MGSKKGPDVGEMQRKGLGTISKLEQQQQKGFASQMAMMQQAMESMKSAESSTQKSFQGARTEARDRSQQLVAGAQQNLQQRGLGSTTLQGNLAIGAGAANAKAMEGLASAESGAMGSAMGRTGGMQAAMASLYGQQTGQQTALGLEKLPFHTMQEAGGPGQGQKAMSGAMSGAAAGAALGPWGALGGAGIGGAMGYFS